MSPSAAPVPGLPLVAATYAPQPSHAAGAAAPPDTLSPCLVWQGRLNHHGYGVECRPRADKRGGYDRFVHRRVMEQHIGRELSSAEHVLHHCDNPPCYLLEHLYIGTPADNVADMIRRGRASNPPSQIGTDHPNAKLTDEAVQNIRRRLADGEVQAAIGRLYGVDHTIIRDIKFGRLWTHVPFMTVPEQANSRRTSIPRPFLSTGRGATHDPNQP